MFGFWVPGLPRTVRTLRGARDDNLDKAVIPLSIASDFGEAGHFGQNGVHHRFEDRFGTGNFEGGFNERR